MRIACVIFVCFVSSALWKYEACKTNDVAVQPKLENLAELDEPLNILSQSKVYDSPTPLHQIEEIINPPLVTAEDLKDTRPVPHGSKRIILVGGGTYSPVTIMHLRLFERVRDHLEGKTPKDDKLKTNYHVVRGILSPVGEQYKKKERAPKKDRVAMAALAVHGNDWIKVDPWESEQPEYVPTDQLLKHYRDLAEELKSKDGIDRQVMFLCGSDLILDFPISEPKKINDEVVQVRRWPDKDIEAIMEYGLVILWRPNTGEPEEAFEKVPVIKDYKNNPKIIIVKEWAEVGISSSAIRAALKAAASIRYFVADPVLDYIKERKPWDFLEKTVLPRDLNIDEANGKTGESSAHEDGGWNTPPGVFPGIGDY